MIPDKAIEAALLAMRGLNFWDYKDADYVRAALEAAAPHLQSAAWERGVEDGYHHRPNPYKEQGTK